jgi:hypothetical protein
VPRIVVEKPKSSEICAPLTLFNSQPISLEVFPFIIPPKEINRATFSKRGSIYQSSPTPLEYRFQFEPWSGDSLAGLNNTLPLISADYRKKPTSFKFSKRNSFEKYIPNIYLSESFEQKWEPLTTASWRISYKLFYIFWIQESVKTLYKGYGKEILQSLVSILVALGFDVNQILEFLGLKETESGLRIIEKSKRRFDDIAGVDSLLPELGETVWFLKTKGNLPVFQTPAPPNNISIWSSSKTLHPLLFLALHFMQKMHRWNRCNYLSSDRSRCL